MALDCYIVLGWAGEDWPREAGAHADAGLRLLRERGILARESWHLLQRAHLHVEAGELASAEEALARARDSLALYPDPPTVLYIAVVAAELAFAEGRLEDAAAGFPEVTEVARVAGRGLSRWHGAALARTSLALGDATRARDAIRDLVLAWDRGQEGPYVKSALLPTAAVEVAVAPRDRKEARRWTGELEALGSEPRASYAQALSRTLADDTSPVDAIVAAAAGVEGDERRLEAAWMLAISAELWSRAGDSDGAARLATSALARFRAMGAEGWCRRLEALLRRLGRRAPGHRPCPGARASPRASSR